MSSLTETTFIELPKYLAKPHATAPSYIEKGVFWGRCNEAKFDLIPIEIHSPTHASVHHGAICISVVLRPHAPDAG